jgi:hypothetical protein
MRSISAVIGLLAIVGFASAANAAVTLDLLWAGSSSPSTSAASSSTVTLNVVLTNDGPTVSQGGGVTIDYTDGAGNLGVVSFTPNPNTAVPGTPLPIIAGLTTDTGTQVRNINAAAFVPYVGAGLAIGATYLMGTVQFHSGGSGTFNINSAITATDGFIDVNGITNNPPIANATISVPEPAAIATTLVAVAALVGVGWVRRNDRA